MIRPAVCHCLTARREKSFSPRTRFDGVQTSNAAQRHRRAWA